MIWQGKKEVYGYRTENFKMGYPIYIYPIG